MAYTNLGQPMPPMHPHDPHAPECALTRPMPHCTCHEAQCTLCSHVSPCAPLHAHSPPCIKGSTPTPALASTLRDKPRMGGGLAHAGGSGRRIRCWATGQGNTGKRPPRFSRKCSILDRSGLSIHHGETSGIWPCGVVPDFACKCTGRRVLQRQMYLIRMPRPED